MSGTDRPTPPGQEHAGRRRKISPRRLRLVLEETRGCIAATARRLGCSRRTIYHMLAFHPELAEVVQAWREELVDEAEAGLWEALKERQRWAICFTLRMLGWSRGYGRREEKPSEPVRAELDLSQLPEEVLRLLQQLSKEEGRHSDVPAQGNCLSAGAWGFGDVWQTREAVAPPTFL